MQRRITFLFLPFLLALIPTLPCAADSPPYVWQNVPIGGGGYVLDVYCHPKQRDLVYIRTDVGGFFRWNPKQTRWVPITDRFPRRQSNYYGGTGPTFYTEQFAWCPTRPRFVARAGVIPWSNSGGVAISQDGGRTWTGVPAWDSKLMAARIAVSANSSDNMVVLSVRSGTAQVTTDGGKSWRPVSGLPDDLIPDVWNWQTLLAADGARPGVFYVYSGGRVLKSTDGGARFVVSAGGLPSGGRGLVTVPGRAGDIWLVAEGGGLWHSTDGTRTFRSIPGVKAASLLAVGKAAPDARYPALYLYGTLRDGRDGIFRSLNAGISWQAISDPQEPVGDEPNSMAASWDTFGLVFIGTNGRGVYYGTPNVHSAAGRPR